MPSPPFFLKLFWHQSLPPPLFWSRRRPCYVGHQCRQRSVALMQFNVTNIARAFARIVKNFSKNLLIYSYSLLLCSTLYFLQNEIQYFLCKYYPSYIYFCMICLIKDFRWGCGYRNLAFIAWVFSKTSKVTIE